MSKRTVEYRTIDEYIAHFPPEVRRKMEQLRALIREGAPGAQEKISWDMPTFVLYRNLVHFAAFKNHIGFYPGASGVEAFQDKLDGYKTSKGTIRFPLEDPLPEELIREIVAFRVAENTALAEAKKKRT